LSEIKFVPERLVAAMKKAKIGDTKLAEQAGISRQMVFLMRKGQRQKVSAAIIGQIATALNTTTDYLMGGDMESKEPPMQKLPEPIRQLAEIANDLSEARQEELLRIAAALLQLEREQHGSEPMSTEDMRMLLELTEKVKEEGDEGSVLQSLKRLLKNPPPGWTVDLRPGNQDGS
jgi:transcriptional regulator with XRE-family HTH domain